MMTDDTKQRILFILLSLECKTSNKNMSVHRKTRNLSICIAVSAFVGRETLAFVPKVQRRDVVPYQLPRRSTTASNGYITQQVKELLPSSHGHGITSLSSLTRQGLEEEETTKKDDEYLDFKFDPYLVLIPLLFNVLAFTSFHAVEDSYEYMYEMFAKAMGVNFKFVDGGNIQAQMISPTLNGIVLPTASLLFSTMVSNTIGTLRGRIQDIKMCLNKEAADIFKLSTLLDLYPDDGYFNHMTKESVSSLRKQCKQYLQLYTEQLISESQDGYDHDSPDMTSQVQGQELYKTIQYYAAYANNTTSIPTHVLTDSLTLIDRLDDNRMTRMTLLRAPYPVLHYMILGVLATAIIFAFLMQTNQDLLQFMNDVQLTLLWTMLVGALSLIGLVIYDLNGPFRGSYRVTNAIRQLSSIRRQFND
jgi:hypothetical protein